MHEQERMTNHGSSSADERNGACRYRSGTARRSTSAPESIVQRRARNFVTTADVASQQFLVETLTPLLPDAHFLAEEDEIHTLHPDTTGSSTPSTAPQTFIRGCQCSAISVGLCLDQEMVAGVVYDPYRKELFAASKGNGATMNGEPIHAADRPIEESLIAIGTSPYYRDLIPKTFRTAQALFEVGGDLRRTAPPRWICAPLPADGTTPFLKRRCRRGIMPLPPSFCRKQERSSPPCQRNASPSITMSRSLPQAKPSTLRCTAPHSMRFWEKSNPFLNGCCRRWYAHPVRG